jgi:chaperonin GroES
MDVKVGEVVLFAKYAGTDVKVADETLKIMSVSDVLGVIE